MPLRLRLSIWNAVVIIGAIFALSMLTYALEARSLAQDLDQSLETQADNLANVYRVRASLSPRARERIIPQPSVFSAPTFYVQVLDLDGAVVERTASMGDRTLPIKKDTLNQAADGQPVLETVSLDGRNIRMYTDALVTDDEFLGYIQVARSQTALEDALAFLRRTLIGAGAVLLLITILVAWFLAGISLRPIGRVTEAAHAISLSGRLDRRLPPEGSHDEVARLVDTFNRMLDRIDATFAAQKRFVADASHELRTPLTTIRGNLELLRRSGAVVEPEMRDALDDVTSEAARMARLVQGLLALARADAGQGLERVPVRLDEVVRAVQREAQALPSSVAVRLDRTDPVQVMGDADALKQLMLILVENGLKYTTEGGVTLSVRYDGGRAILIVRDTGSGIAEEDLPHIFERFYRSPTSRASGGTGLGLAIAKWIADAHNATIDVQTRVGEGTTFTVALDAMPPVPEVGQEVPAQAARGPSALGTRDRPPVTT